MELLATMLVYGTFPLHHHSLNWEANKFARKTLVINIQLNKHLTIA